MSNVIEEEIKECYEHDKHSDDYIADQLELPSDWDPEDKVDDEADDEEDDDDDDQQIKLHGPVV